MGNRQWVIGNICIYTHLHTYITHITCDTALVSSNHYDLRTQATKTGGTKMKTLQPALSSSALWLSVSGHWAQKHKQKHALHGCRAGHSQDYVQASSKVGHYAPNAARPWFHPIIMTLEPKQQTQEKQKWKRSSLHLAQVLCDLVYQATGSFSTFKGYTLRFGSFFHF